MGPKATIQGTRQKGEGRKEILPFPFCLLPLTTRALRASLEKRAELPRPRRVAELAQRLGFDLADALAGDGEVLADLLERVLAAVANAEAHLDHLLLARRERFQDR